MLAVVQSHGLSSFFFAQQIIFLQHQTTNLCWWHNNNPSWHLESHVKSNTWGHKQGVLLIQSPGCLKWFPHLCTLQQYSETLSIHQPIHPPIIPDINLSHQVNFWSSPPAHFQFSSLPWQRSPWGLYLFQSFLWECQCFCSVRPVIFWRNGPGERQLGKEHVHFSRGDAPSHIQGLRRCHHPRQRAVLKPGTDREPPQTLHAAYFDDYSVKSV